MNLIRYAGYQPQIRGARINQNRCPQVYRSYRALLMFRAGKDTAFIAEHFNVREATVLRWITEERSRERSLPNPYQAE